MYPSERDAAIEARPVAARRRTDAQAKSNAGECDWAGRDGYDAVALVAAAAVSETAA
jgi:hypothetical protein